jgi:hypothetical protein
MTDSRAKRFFKGLLVYGAIIGVTLVIIDLICIGLGLFPPRYNFGDPVLGWRSAPVTGQMTFGQCLAFESGTTIRYPRNEDGIRIDRRKQAILDDSTTVRIGATGDSQTDLCARNEDLHSTVTGQELTRLGVPAVTLTFASGRYSPLQAYMAFRQIVKPYRPRVLILNVYTGNDLYDILRSDDRPHFEKADTGYRIAPPVWFALDDPETRRRSRLLYAAKMMGDKTGIRSMYFRFSELRRLGAEHGGGIVEVLAYMKDLWKAREPSVGYADAFSAQMLNQQLFFHHFPGALPESMRRVEALMTMIRQENPDMILVMSPIPSYELVGEQPVDSALTRVLARLPVTKEEGVEQEGGLYRQLESLALAKGWLFVDNLKTLRELPVQGRLYNDFDYHLLPPASAAIGAAEARALLPLLQADASKSPNPRP